MKRVIVSILFLVMFISCKNNYILSDIVGEWHETTGDSIVIVLNADSSFVETILPHTSNTINENSDSILVLSGKWFLERDYQETAFGTDYYSWSIRTTYNDPRSHLNSSDVFEIYNMYLYDELLYWYDGMANFFIFEKRTK